MCLRGERGGAEVGRAQGRGGVRRGGGLGRNRARRVFRTVEDVGVLARDVLPPGSRGLDLELLPHEVLDPVPRAGDGVAPHLEHPPKALVRLGVALELDREVKPVARDRLELLLVQQRGRRPRRLHVLERPFPPLAHDARVVRQLRRAHVGEVKPDGHLRARAVRDGLEQDVVALQDEHVVLEHALRVHVRPQELEHAPRAIDHLEAARLVVAELRAHVRRHQRHQAVWLAVGRGEQPGERDHVGAVFGPLLLDEVVVGEVRLPLHVLFFLYSQQRVERASARAVARSDLVLVGHAHEGAPRMAEDRGFGRIRTHARQALVWSGRTCCADERRRDRRAQRSLARRRAPVLAVHEVLVESEHVHR